MRLQQRQQVKDYRSCPRWSDKVVLPRIAAAVIFVLVTFLISSIEFANGGDSDVGPAKPTPSNTPFMVSVVNPVHVSSDDGLRSHNESTKLHPQMQSGQLTTGPVYTYTSGFGGRRRKRDRPVRKPYGEKSARGTHYYGYQHPKLVPQTQNNTHWWSHAPVPSTQPHQPDTHSTSTNSHSHQESQGHGGGESTEMATPGDRFVAASIVAVIVTGIGVLFLTIVAYVGLIVQAKVPRRPEEEERASEEAEASSVEEVLDVKRITKGIYNIHFHYNEKEATEKEKKRKKKEEREKEEKKEQAADIMEFIREVIAVDAYAHHLGAAKLSLVNHALEGARPEHARGAAIATNAAGASAAPAGVNHRENGSASGGKVTNTTNVKITKRSR